MLKLLPDTVPSFAAGIVCVSFVSIPVTVSCPSCTECIVTVSCPRIVPVVALSCLALTVTCIGVPSTAGSSESASVKVDVSVFCLVVVPTKNS